LINKKTSYSVDEATKLLENYCAYQERCHKEVEQKLYDLNLIPEAKEKIILHLLQHNFLNEERFAKAYVSGKYSIKRWGKNKIVNELNFKNISSYNIKKGLQEIDEEIYLNNLTELAVKKWPLLKDKNSFTKKGKLKNYLISKGYETNLVYEILNNFS
jgi:regulatory protein